MSYGERQASKLSFDTLPQKNATQIPPGADNAERLSILLVNYNGLRYLRPCLESIREFAPSGTRVVMVDNASTDGSVEFMKENFPWVQFIQSDRNLGFAAGNNLAGKFARGKFVLLLNTDVRLLEPLAPAVDWLEKHGGHGALTINMLDGSLTPRACTGRFPSAVRLIRLRSMLVSPDRYSAEKAHDVDWVQGSFLLIRADLWRALDGLDERYFMYVEDVDLCKRVQDAGFRCAYLPQFSYLHWGGFDESRFPGQILGLATYVDRHMSRLSRLACWAVLFSGSLVRVAFYQARGALRSNEIDRTRARVSWRAFKSILNGHA